MRGWIIASISLELSTCWRPIRIRRLPAMRTLLGRQCMQECATRISCKSSSLWDRAMLPKHEADDGLRLMIGRTAVASFSSVSRFLARPVVCFDSGIAAPALVTRYRAPSSHQAGEDPLGTCANSRARQPLDLRTPAQGRARGIRAAHALCRCHILSPSGVWMRLAVAPCENLASGAREHVIVMGSAPSPGYHLLISEAPGRQLIGG